MRFTPTCVGTTRPHFRPVRPGPIHPHVRGDNLVGYFPLPFFSDSPPRAWGQLTKRKNRLVGLRFTPTCVGTTKQKPSLLFSFSIHPHVRGDNHTLRHSFATHLRFTPTCVGTTLKKISIYGTRIRKSPSKSSTERAVFPQLRIRKPCSLSLE